jgi:hypothetical protein
LAFILAFDRFSPHHVDLIYTAALASFWRKNALKKFLRGCGVADGFFATWASDESKRDLLDRLFAKLAQAEGGEKVVARMAKALSEQASFPDLAGWEDSDEKIRAAKVAVEELRRFEQAQTEAAVSAAEKRASQDRYRARQQEVQRSQQDLERLADRLNALASRIGTQQAGYDFQDWFYDLLDYFELTNRRPYVTGGRQIDGSLTHEGTTYLIELKFTTDQADAPDVDTFYKKVSGKADNTMGIMVSMSGYSTVAVAEASAPRTPLLLLDHGHLYAALTRVMSLPDILARVRRHASQTSEAYLPVSKFGG